MAATITCLPVALKRGRKLTKGPMASMSVLYAAPVQQATGNLSDQVEVMAQLLANRVLRARRKDTEYAEWLDSSPTVARFPEGRRFRSQSDVRDLRAGKSSDDNQHEDPLAARIAARCKEIVAEREGGDHG